MDDDFIAHFPALDLRAHRPDDAGGIRPCDMERMLVAVEGRYGDAETGPNAVVIDAAGHHVDQHFLFGDRPSRDDFALHRGFRRSVAFLADGPGVHFLGHIAEWRNLADLIEILKRG